MNSRGHWVEVENYPRYLVSNHGLVMNRVRNKILKPSMNGSGYLFVTLCNNSGQKQLSVHRIVAASFFDCDISDFQINHIDGNKINNCVWNLEVVTQSENILHAHKIGLHSRSSTYRPTGIRIIETNDLFPSVSALGRHLNVSPQRVSHACKNGGSVRGYHFEYTED